MRSKVVNILALTFVLGGVGIVTGQQNPQPDEKLRPPQRKKIRVEEEDTPRPPMTKAPQEKSKLEGMLAEALKNNPDIRVAAANLALAEAELYRTRLQVTQKVLTLYHAIQTQQATVEYEQKQYARYQGLLQDRAIDQKLVDERATKLAASKAKLAELEAQMSGLLGKTPLAAYHLTIQEAKLVRHESLRTRRPMIEEAEWERAHKATGPLAQSMRKALETPVKVDYRAMSLADVFRDLEKKAPGLSLRDRYASRYKLDTVTLSFDKPMPVAAVLQALEDIFIASDNNDRNLGLCFVVRQYGILAAPRRELPMYGAMTIEEFLRHKPTEK